MESFLTPQISLIVVIHTLKRINPASQHFFMQFSLPRVSCLLVPNWGTMEHFLWNIYTAVLLTIIAIKQVRIV